MRYIGIYNSSIYPTRKREKKERVSGVAWKSRMRPNSQEARIRRGLLQLRDRYNKTAMLGAFHHKYYHWYNYYKKKTHIYIQDSLLIPNLPFTVFKTRECIIVLPVPRNLPARIMGIAWGLKCEIFIWKHLKRLPGDNDVNDGVPESLKGEDKARGIG